MLEQNWLQLSYLAPILPRQSGLQCVRYLRQPSIGAAHAAQRCLLSVECVVGRQVCHCAGGYAKIGRVRGMRDMLCQYPACETSILRQSTYEIGQTASMYRLQS